MPFLLALAGVLTLCAAYVVNTDGHHLVVSYAMYGAGWGAVFLAIVWAARRVGRN